MKLDGWQSTAPAIWSERYGSVAILFHWSMFLLVVLVGVLRRMWPKRTPS